MKDFKVIVTKISYSEAFPNEVFKEQETLICKWADKGYNVSHKHSIENLSCNDSRYRFHRYSAFEYNNISPETIEVWVGHSREALAIGGKGYISEKRIYA